MTKNCRHHRFQKPHAATLPWAAHCVHHEELVGNSFVEGDKKSQHEKYFTAVEDSRVRFTTLVATSIKKVAVLTARRKI